MPRKHKSVGASEDKPVCLVVEHKVKEPSHSIVIAGGRSTRTPPVMVPVRNFTSGMSFAVVDSRWIVGVGGDSSLHNIVYDLATSTESEGPRLLNSKVNPILIPHRGMLYILSSRPRIYDLLCPDFLPWFELIIFTNAKGRLHSCAPSELPPPPIFPYSIDPYEYANPPDVRVAAYAVVDSHILLSVSVSVSLSSQQQQQRQQQHHQRQQYGGTCAFDMDRQVWDMVDTKSLPFLGQAIPLGDHLFVAHCIGDDGGTTAVYYIAVVSLAKDTTTTSKTELSIIKLKQLDLPKGGIVPGQHLCSLGMTGCFSSFDVVHGPDTSARVIQRTYSLVKGADITTNHKVVKWQKQIFELLDATHLFACSAPLVAAFTAPSSSTSSTPPA